MPITRITRAHHTLRPALELPNVPIADNFGPGAGGCNSRMSRDCLNILVESAKYPLKYCMGLVRGNVWGVSMDQNYSFTSFTAFLQ